MTTNRVKDHWREASGLGSTDLFRGLIPSCSSLKILRKHMLRAQSEMLKGFMAVVDNELAGLEKPPRPAKQKVTVK